jgi:spermidine/putrescine transport system ATP-binding protein
MMHRTPRAPAPARPARGEVGLVALTKRFGDTVAVDGIDLDVRAGELFSLLGPSGCGKTTTLRLIAGFEQPTSGEIRLDGRPVAHVPAHRRDVHTVFQSYALFPHLDVYDNVAFGLRRRRVPAVQARARVDEALELVQLGGLARRRPAQLSGGQQQRVALARALVLRPAVLLLDEPLGALDAKLRRQLRVELKALQEQVGITFVFVTHDQEEALSMSDRIAVMNQGRIEQVGTPQALYDEPATLFVANFLAVSNVTRARVEAVDADGCRLRVGELGLRARRCPLPAAAAAAIVVRPERVVLEPFGPVGGDNRLPGVVERTVYLGASSQVLVRLATGATIQVSVANTGGDAGYRPGTPVWAHLPADAIRVLGTVPGGPGPGVAAGPAGRPAAGTGATEPAAVEVPA